MKYAIIVFGTFLFISPFSESLRAAKPKSMPFEVKHSKQALSQIKKAPSVGKTISISMQDKKNVENALKLPLKNRVEAIKKQGIKSFYALKSLALDDSKSTQIRWKSLITFAMIGKARARSLVETTSKSKHWYMRNASLIASKYVEKYFSLDLAKKMIADHALVVRTEAVKIIDKFGDSAHKDILWGQLNSPINFRNGKSLWVRKHITQALANKAEREDISNFVRLLSDQDIHVKKFAVLGLESIYSERLSQSKSLNEHVRLWKEKVSL